MKTKLLLLTLTMVYCLSTSLIGQDTLDVAPFTEEGVPNLVPAIIGDTTETGERANLNRVYRLQYGGVYLMDQTIFADFPIRLVAGGDQTLRPPMLVRGKYPTGDPIKTFFTFTANGLSHSFENIIFTGVDENREYLTQWNRGLKIAGDDIRLEMSHCIFNAWAGLFLEVTGNNASLFIRDSEWRNGVGAQAPPWGAQQTVVFATKLDTVIFTNNTCFNTGGFWLFQEDGVADYVKVEHNTIFTGLIDQVRMRDFINTDFRSNLFYATHAYGQTQSERDASWFDKDGERISMFSIDTSAVDLLANWAGITESDKRILVTNNAYFSPQALKDWWASIPGLYTPVWMHERTMGMFSNDDMWPHLDAYDNIEMDPNFVDKDMESWVVDEVIKYCDNTRKGLALSSRNYDEHTGSADVLLFNWPLPENLAYTNEILLTGGHDGLPVGDLNWFPDKREEYVEFPTSTVNLPAKDFSIKKISPNPAYENLYINVDFGRRGQANVDILDLEGKVLISKDIFVNSGSNDFIFDVSDFDSGLYILRIKTSKGVSSRRFVIAR